MDAPASVPVPVSRIGRDNPTGGADRVAVEEPLEIRLWTGHGADDDPQSLAITMRTPGKDAELVAGFLWAEGVVRRAGDIVHIGSPADNVVDVRLSARVEFDPARLQRHFYATSSCGICGKASLDALKVRPAVSLHDNRARFDRVALLALPDRLVERQAVFADTGGLHGAACFDGQGRLGAVHEDVGRHNALDKLVGAELFAGRVPLGARGILVSGRAGFELAQKALMAGSPLLVAVGAPSSLAVDLAWEFDMTLVGFLRDGRFNIYAGPQRIA